MRVLVIPDVHLKPDMIDKAASLMTSHKFDNAVFLGDFVDDWNQGRNIGLYDNTFDALDKFLRLFPNSLICYGNHDISYVWNKLETGYSAFAHDTVMARLHDLYRAHGIDRWKFIHKIDDVLFSHAGITTDFLKKHRMSKKSADEIVEKINRMGREELWVDASPIWARPRHFEYNICLQVVGHTPLSQVTYYKRFNLLVTDNHSTFDTGTPDKSMVWVDTKTGAFEALSGNVRITDHILGHPMYKRKEHVFIKTSMKKGKIMVVDACGTTGQRDEPSYDVYVDEDHCLYKHIRESEIVSKD